MFCSNLLFGSKSEDDFAILEDSFLWVGEM